MACVRMIASCIRFAFSKLSDAALKTTADTIALGPYRCKRGAKRVSYRFVVAPHLQLTGQATHDFRARDPQPELPAGARRAPEAAAAVL